MQKSNFQILAEELEQDIIKLKKEINVKKQLLEKAPPPIATIDYISDIDVKQPNTGTVAGMAVGAAANPAAIVLNPNVLSAAKGKIFADADPRIVKFKPYSSNNLGSMMGLGLDMATFTRAKEFIKQYSPPDGGVVEKDDPEESVALDWKRLNNAVSNFNSQRVKGELIKGGIFNGNVTNPYEQGVSDQYQRFVLGKRAQKAVENSVTNILGKPSKSKGKEVTAILRSLSQAQQNRLGNMWSGNPDQSGKIKLGNRQ